MFLRNYWYVAATDAKIGRKPLGRTILGEPVVFFPHRGRHACGIRGPLRSPAFAAFHGQAGRR